MAGEDPLLLLRVVGLGDLDEGIFVLLEQGLHAGRGLHDTLLHRQVLVEARLLGEVTERVPRHLADGAVELLVLTGHDLQQGRLAGTVEAEYPDFGAEEIREGDIAEDGLLLEELGHPRHGEDHFFVGHGSEGWDKPPGGKRNQRGAA